MSKIKIIDLDIVLTVTKNAYLFEEYSNLSFAFLFNDGKIISYDAISGVEEIKNTEEYKSLYGFNLDEDEAYQLQDYDENGKKFLMALKERFKDLDKVYVMEM